MHTFKNFLKIMHKHININTYVLNINLFYCINASFYYFSYIKKLTYAVRAFIDEENSMVHLEKFHSTGAAGVADNMHKMLKAFLQSAPQLLLQMYILLSTDHQHVPTG